MSNQQLKKKKFIIYISSYAKLMILKISEMIARILDLHNT